MYIHRGIIHVVSTTHQRSSYLLLMAQGPRLALSEGRAISSDVHLLPRSDKHYKHDVTSSHRSGLICCLGGKIRERKNLTQFKYDENREEF